ncbi:hypothetical protein, partial [Streptomyces sp. ATMOS53]
MSHRHRTRTRSGKRGRNRSRIKRTATAVLLVLAAQVALVDQGSGASFAADGNAPAAHKPKAAKKAAGPAQAQDEASAVLMARLQKRKIEVLSARTADSSTFALPNG